MSFDFAMAYNQITVKPLTVEKTADFYACLFVQNVQNAVQPLQRLINFTATNGLRSAQLIGQIC